MFCGLSQNTLVHTHYALSVAIEVVQLFAPPPGSHQLCAPHAAQWGLAELVYHYVCDAKNLLPYISTVVNML